MQTSERRAGGTGLNRLRPLTSVESWQHQRISSVVPPTHIEKRISLQTSTSYGTRHLASLIFLQLTFNHSALKHPRCQVGTSVGCTDRQSPPPVQQSRGVQDQVQVCLSVWDMVINSDENCDRRPVDTITRVTPSRAELVAPGITVPGDADPNLVLIVQ